MGEIYETLSKCLGAPCSTFRNHSFLPFPPRPYLFASFISFIRATFVHVQNTSSLCGVQVFPVHVVVQCRRRHGRFEALQGTGDPDFAAVSKPMVRVAICGPRIYDRSLSNCAIASCPCPGGLESLETRVSIYSFVSARFLVTGAFCPQLRALSRAAAGRTPPAPTSARVRLAATA